MTNNQPELLFSQPVKIRDGVELKIFNDQTADTQYLLISGDRHYVINSFVYGLIQIIYEFNDLETIKLEFSKRQCKQYETNEIITVINDILVQKEIVEALVTVNNKKQKSFLHFKTTIFSRNILVPITDVLQVFFKAKVVYLSLVIILVSHSYIAFFYFNSAKLANVMMNDPYLLAVTMFVTLLSTIFHEFGHSSACRFLGVDFKEIGFAIYIRFPVLYSNITDAWRLPQRKRILVDIAGIYFQYIFNVILIIIFLITKQSMLVYIVNLVCVQTFFTLNPFFRYDGYWITSDFLGVHNLREKSDGMLTYIIQKYLLRRKSKQNVILHIKPFAKILFLFYTLISNIFFIFFIYLFIRHSPTVIETIPAIINEISNISQYIDQYSFSERIVVSYKILIRIFFLGLSIYFFYSLLVRIMKLIRKSCFI